MFTPASRKHHLAAAKSRASPGSPSTPGADGRTPLIPNRPATGTPAPWATRLSVLARIPTNDQPEKGAYGDQIQPVYVREVPKIVRKAYAEYIQRKAYESVSVAADDCFSGGMDKSTFLSWMICEDQIFIWSYLASSPSSKCIVLDFPTGLGATYYVHSYQLMLYIINWEAGRLDNNKKEDSCNSAGLIICHKKTHAVIYWPDVFSENGRIPSIWLPNMEQSRRILSCRDEDTRRNDDQRWVDQLAEGSSFNSIIASPIPGFPLESIVFACQSNGELLCFHCTSSKISLNKISLGLEGALNGDTSIKHASRVYARSIAWQCQHLISDTLSRQFFLLTDHEIQCWNAILAPDSKVKKLWSHEIVGTDGGSGIKKDLAGQKHIWLLDMQIDDSGKEFTILVATICKDRASGSSYTQYSLLNMQYEQEQNASFGEYDSENVLEKKVPIQVIIPKAKMEDESFLFSMRLRIGGKPSGSAVILSQDGTATVANYWRGATRLYKFDLPHDAGKVLDASIFPSGEDGEGTWVVLTERAGIWAIPEKAVLLGGVEPPERSLSRKGSSNGVPEGGKRNWEVHGIIAPRRSSSEAWSTGDREGASVARILKQTAQDEEAEVLLGNLYQDFLLTGKAEGALEKLSQSGAFEKEGEINAFARMSRSIVDTLAKHWTSTRGAEFVTSAVVVSQLLDKQQKHERFLQFLALSKCHEELSTRQKQSLQIIVEHGEKIFGMIQLRELQNLLSQNQPSRGGSPSSLSLNDASGALWELIQLVGERARRNNVLLMDRDDAEVFYSKVSDLEELLYCISHHLSSIIDETQHLSVQIHRAHEICNSCVTLIHAAMRYRNEHQTWYPPPEGLIPWNCQPVVRSGLWSIASIVVRLLKEASENLFSVKSGLYSQLEHLADIILESYINTITAKDEQGEDVKGLLEEYHKRRDTLLDSLYQEAVSFANSHYKESLGVEDDNLRASTFREFLQPVLSIAKRHEGYQTLWNICYELHDTGLLRSLMHESLGPRGGFGNFVFRKLFEKGQFSKLLRLGEGFQDELAMYLKHHRDLLWLHEVFLNRFSSASDTLYDFSISHDEEHSYGMRERDESSYMRQLPDLASRRRFLSLSKISAMAGKAEGFELKIKRIEADIQILKLQEMIMANQEVKVVDKILSPLDLIRICLEGRTRELSLVAFDVFAWTSSQFRSTNKRLLEECWRNAADQDDWEALHQQSLAEGWSDEVCIQHLQKTIPFQASDKCYGPNAPTFEGRFEDVLPLQNEDMGYPTLMTSPSSVEGILMQHKDFPDAGKLMVTAVMLGKMGVNIVEDADMEV